MVPSIGAWAELAAELKRRREELATNWDSAAQAAALIPPSSQVTQGVEWPPAHMLTYLQD